MSRDPKVVVVTGAGAGAGRAIAARFGREGWRVGLLSRDRDRLEAAREEIEAAGGQGLVLPTDMSNADAVFAARDKVVETWGGIDAWINCAMATIVGKVDDIAIPDFKRVVDVTLMGYVHGTKAALGAMRPAGNGAIVQVGSALAYRAIPLQSAYCTCKFAIRGFTDSLRAELIHEKSKITVSMLQMPGMNTIRFDWAKHLRTHGVPVVGYTWYSTTDQIDWGIQLKRIEDKVTKNGLCTLDRKLRPVGEAYKKLAHANAGSLLIGGVPSGLLTL